MSSPNPHAIRQPWNESQEAARAALVRDLAASPIPPDELLDNLPLYASRSAMGRILHLHSLYERILDVHGAVLVFGVRWGRDLAILQALRSLLEPGNAARKIIGFDTFSGFPSTTSLDGGAAAGGYGVTEAYQDVLAEVLEHRDGDEQNLYPRRELVVGDVVETFPKWLEEHPETIVAMAYLDVDLYEPTKACLDALKPYVTRGTVIGMDEVAFHGFPGETVALRESWGLADIRLQRTRYVGSPSFFVVE
ncbi:TylF/MycF/NovP-related O-methyltransferase [Blastococcus litoris]|uniref:TylF/MycF/NovP-related O-methyltransferase n=1 Tax=Blastococcus litoris TaxID=2171622 RepID=UPI0013E0E4C1|nr:TylF/MycF/NovP-related O-methyltransferase [Blastococcus litoris]